MSPYFKFARLVRPDDRLPWHGRLFGVGTDHPGFEIVDPRDTLTAALLADRSIELAEPPALAPTPSASS